MPVFYVSRLNVVGKEDDLEKSEFLFQKMELAKELIYRKDTFKLTSLDVFKVGAKNYLAGVIVKYKPDHEERVINDENKIEPFKLKNKVLSEIAFIIDPKESIIVYEEDRSHIPSKSFDKIFSALLDEQRIEISAITESYNFIESIKEISEIKKIVIDLVPSNPNSSHLWDRYDKKFHQEKITKYKEIKMNNRKGESIVIDDETKAKFHMAEDGYGNSIVSGKDQSGKTITKTTEDASKQAKINVALETRDPRHILDKLKEKLNNIIKRTRES